MEAVLEKIVANKDLHVRWLATLSHLENCGARKIVRFEPSRNVPLDILQHAAEETRHAFFLRRLILKLDRGAGPDFALLGGALGRHYLERLDLRIARYLAAADFSGRPLRQGCYLLTTYAIEKRAEALYPLYETVLRRQQSPLSLLTLIKEEENHLIQIEKELAKNPMLDSLKTQVRAWEEELYASFLACLRQDVARYESPSAYAPLPGRAPAPSAFCLG